MNDAAISPPTMVLLLADHLDAALAAGEDLARVGADQRMPAAPREAGEFARLRATQRDTVEQMRLLEGLLVMRVLQARQRGQEIAAQDRRFMPLAKLFVSGTAPLVDAVAECGDATGLDFETGEGVVPYLRSRALVDPDAAGLCATDIIRAGECFLVAGRIALGPLLDLIATFLDSLALHYELYPEGETQDGDAAAQLETAHPVETPSDGSDASLAA